MVAGLQGESGRNLDPGAYNPNDRGLPSGGTAQWRDQRLRNLQAFARQRGEDWKSRETQQQFLRHEMVGSGSLGGGSERHAYNRLRAAKTERGSVQAFVAGFERPQFPASEAAKRAGYLSGHPRDGAGPSTTQEVAAAPRPRDEAQRPGDALVRDRPLVNPGAGRFGLDGPEAPKGEAAAQPRARRAEAEDVGGREGQRPGPGQGLERGRTNADEELSQLQRLRDEAQRPIPIRFEGTTPTFRDRGLLQARREMSYEMRDARHNAYSDVGVS